jgi:hypothetical protein
LISFINNPDHYIQDFITVIQTFELASKDVMLLLSQTLTSLEQQTVLGQATQVGNDLSYSSLLLSPHP